MEKQILVIFLLVVTSFVYLLLAKKYNIIDKPNERSSHTKITVRGGGILFTMAILLFYLLNNQQYVYFIAGVLIISLVSFLDDIFTLTSKVRFPFQFIGVFLVLYQVSLPFLPLPIYLFYFTIGVAVVNMFNFMDGINGITGLYSFAVLFGLYLINSNEQLIDANLIHYVLVSIIVFGFYNFRRKALFFAGDIGSITIGMLVFFIGIFFTITLSSPLISLMILVYAVDAGCTMFFRKVFTNESIFEPHRHHIYQKLVDFYNVSHLKMSIIYGVIQLVVNLIVYKTYQLPMNTQYLLFFILIALFTGVYVYLFMHIKRHLAIKNKV